MSAKHLLPNAVTLANIAFGFLGIVAAAEGHFERACVLLFLGAMCDLADGRLARLLNATSKFGMELDSLSDMVSFGIAPAVLVYLAVLRQYGMAGAAISVVYVLCGALRLARFNLATDELSTQTFLGCPIPVACGYLLTFTMVRSSLPLWLVAFGVLWISGCMISTVKVPKFRRGQLPAWMMILGIVGFAVFLATPTAITWHIWNGWNMVMIAANYFMLARRGHLTKQRHEPRSLKKAA